MSSTRSASPRSSVSKRPLGRDAVDQRIALRAADAGGERSRTGSPAPGRTPPGTGCAAGFLARRALAAPRADRRRTPGRERRPPPRCGRRPLASGSPSSASVGSSAGGRLSTTNQPRSSRHFAAVLRPAPERPVMIASCTGRRCRRLRARGGLAHRGQHLSGHRIDSGFSRPAGQRRDDRLSGTRPDPGHLGDLLERRRPQPLQRTELRAAAPCAGSPPARGRRRAGSPPSTWSASGGDR